MTALLSTASAAAAAAPPPPPTVAALTAEGGWTSSYTASQWLDTPALEVGLGSALLLCCVVCCSLQFYTWRVRRKKLEESAEAKSQIKELEDQSQPVFEVLDGWTNG